MKQINKKHLINGLKNDVKIYKMINGLSKADGAAHLMIADYIKDLINRLRDNQHDIVN